MPVNVFVPVGLQELDNAGISIFPNPAHQVLNVNLKTASQTNIKIFDATARLVKNEMINSISNKISIAELNAGVYQLFIQKDGKQFIHKLILN